jgi:hypothetical protein
VEYLLELERALEELGGEVDEHVRDLAERVRGLEREGVVGVVAGGRRGVGGHEEEEEVEVEVERVVGEGGGGVM